MFLGYSAGKMSDDSLGSFDIEFLPSAFQTKGGTGEAEIKKKGGIGKGKKGRMIANSTSNIAASSFFLSSPSQLNAPANQPLKSSWVTDPNLKMKAHPDFPPPSTSSSSSSSSATSNMSFPQGDLIPSRPPSTFTPATISAMNEGSTSTSASSPTNTNTTVSVLPSHMRTTMYGSVIVYLNSFFLWKPRNFSEITVDSLSFITKLSPKPDLLLVGCGVDIPSRLPPDVLAMMSRLNIGVEQMDSANAAAIYNILVEEGRTVLAALIQIQEKPIVTYKESGSERARRRLNLWNEPPPTQPNVRKE